VDLTAAKAAAYPALAPQYDYVFDDGEANAQRDFLVQVWVRAINGQTVRLGVDLNDFYDPSYELTLDNGRTKVPEGLLYHGTFWPNVASILRAGLVPGGRMEHTARQRVQVHTSPWPHDNPR
jgi:RNA:NAD 2'-phosphotransferase (TPT1/KptA family)